MSTNILAAEQPIISVVTEDLYPFNYLEGSEIKGSSTDRIKKTLKELGWENVEFKVLPWARAYDYALKEPNVLIYSILRVPDRENLFKWSNKVATTTAGVIKLKARKDISVKRLKDLKNYKMGAYVGSPIIKYLKDYDINVTSVVGRYKSLIPMLMQGRIDVFPGSVDSFFAEANKQGYGDLFEVQYYLEDLSKDLYCAFSTETDDKIVDQFKEAFQKVNIQ